MHFMMAEMAKYFLAAPLKGWFEKLNVNVRFWLILNLKKMKILYWIKEEIHIPLNESSLHHCSCCPSASRDIRGIAASVGTV